MVSSTSVDYMDSPTDVVDSTPAEELAPEPKKRRLRFSAPTLDWAQHLKPDEHEQTSEKRAAFMFYAAMGWMLLLSLTLPHGISDAVDDLFRFNPLLWVPLTALWVLIIAEGLLGFATARDELGSLCKRFLLTSVMPAFRLTLATAYPHRFVWLPKRHWLAVGKLNFERLELRIAVPMLGLTLMVLPLLGVEFLLRDYLQENLWLGVIVHALTSLLWFGFAFEFLVMFSLADKKLAYCKAHWINIVIILMPLIMWLRLVRMLSFLKVSKMIRAFRLRSITARGMRLAMVFNLVDRLMERNPEKYLLALEDKALDKKAELQALEEKMVEMKAKIAKQEAELATSQSPGRPESERREAQTEVAKEQSPPTVC